MSSVSVSWGMVLTAEASGHTISGVPRCRSAGQAVAIRTCLDLDRTGIGASAPALLAPRVLPGVLGDPRNTPGDLAELIQRDFPCIDVILVGIAHRFPYSFFSCRWVTLLFETLYRRECIRIGL